MKIPVCKQCGGPHYASMYHKKPSKKKRPIVKEIKVKVKKKAQFLDGSKKSKRPSRKKLVDKLDSVFSQFVRLSNADSEGNVRCYTCDANMHWKEAQNGHFYTRGRYATRWDINNCRVQDYRCNIILKGNYIVYTRRMIAEIGEHGVDELERLSKTTVKIPTHQLQDMIEDYSHRVEMLLK